jgi:hypothetical protein
MKMKVTINEDESEDEDEMWKRGLHWLQRYLRYTYTTDDHCTH